MNSRNGALLGAQRPRVRVAPPSRQTDGDLAAFLSSSYGLKPDEWQSLVLDDWLATRADGKWSALTCGLAVPRQNGKNGLIEMRELYGIVELGERFLHTAHEVKTARKAFLRLCSFFENKRAYPELAELVSEIRRTNGQEAVVLRNGGSVEFVARSKGSGRGFTVDVLVMDEAQELSDDALEALMPTTSAAPLGNPQWILTGTPPGPSANGEVFTRTRTDAIEGSGVRLCWHEWSCVGDVDLDDRRQWEATNPSLGHRLQADVLEGERSRFSNAGFARERLGVWALPNRVRAVIALPAWEAREAKAPPPQNELPVAIGLDRWHDGTTALAGSWPHNDGTHVELLAHDQARDAAGIVEWVVNRAGRKIPVLIAADSPAASLAADLIARKVKVRLLSGPEFARSCQAFVDDAIDGPLTHADQERLNDALAAATKLPVGKAGAWVWDRRKPDNDISPLVAATLARHGAAGKTQRTGAAYQRR